MTFKKKEETVFEEETIVPTKEHPSTEKEETDARKQVDLYHKMVTSKNNEIECMDLLSS